MFDPTYLECIWSLWKQAKLIVSYYGQRMPTKMDEKKQNLDEDDTTMMNNNNEFEKWNEVASMEKPRRLFGATTVGERIIVVGGYDDNLCEHLSSAEIYNPYSNRWSSLPDMNHKRGGCAITSVNGKVYAIGGHGYGSFTSGEMLDLATDQWTAIPDMKEARVCCTACTIGNKLYVIGGRNSYAGVSLVSEFDTMTQKWSSLPNMIEKRSQCAAVSVGRNKIYVFGGRGAYKCLSSAEVYDIHTQTWTQLPDMKERRDGCAATAVGNQIYVVGGCDVKSLSSCEVFDTSTHTWSSTTIIPDMMEERGGCQAVSIGPKIYVISKKTPSTSQSSTSMEMLERSMESLYPINDNYVTVKGEYKSPKSLEHLCMDEICRSLPNLDGDFPPGLPQDIIKRIHESLVNHGALDSTTMKPLRHYLDLDDAQLQLAECHTSNHNR